MRLMLALAAALLLAPAATWAGGPSNLAGEFLFENTGRTHQRIVSRAVLDQAFNEYCSAGRVGNIDEEATPQRRVEFRWTSLGSIESETPTSADGVFDAVDLTVRVYFFEVVTPSRPPVFETTVSGLCTLDAKVQADPSLPDDETIDRSRASLDCELGPQLEALAIPDSNPIVPPFLGCGGAPCPPLTRQDVLDSIERAFAKKKFVKIDIAKGTFRVRHPAVELSDFNIRPPLVCTTSSDAD